MISLSETFTLTDELYTKDYIAEVQTKIDELIDLLINASNHIPGSGNENLPIWEYVKDENYTAMFALVSLLTSCEKLDKDPERVKELHDLIYND